MGTRSDVERHVGRGTKAHSPPSHISKTVLSTVYVGGPECTVLHCELFAGRSCCKESSLVDPAVLPQVRGQPGATGSVHTSLQPGELGAQAMPAQGGQALVVGKPPGQTYQDRGEASSPRPAAGVSASRGSSASGGISTSAGAYRRAPSSTRVASILGIIGGDEDSQGGAVRLDELKSVQTC